MTKRPNSLKLKLDTLKTLTTPAEVHGGIAGNSISSSTVAPSIGCPPTTNW